MSFSIALDLQFPLSPFLSLIFSIFSVTFLQHYFSIFSLSVLFLTSLLFFFVSLSFAGFHSFTVEFSLFSFCHLFLCYFLIFLILSLLLIALFSLNRFSFTTISTFFLSVSPIPPLLTFFQLRFHPNFLSIFFLILCCSCSWNCVIIPIILRGLLLSVPFFSDFFLISLSFLFWYLSLLVIPLPLSFALGLSLSLPLSRFFLSLNLISSFALEYLYLHPFAVCFLTDSVLFLLLSVIDRTFFVSSFGLTVSFTKWLFFSFHHSSLRFFVLHSTFPQICLACFFIPPSLVPFFRFISFFLSFCSLLILILSSFFSFSSVFFLPFAHHTCCRYLDFACFLFSPFIPFLYFFALFH